MEKKKDGLNSNFIELVVAACQQEWQKTQPSSDFSICMRKLENLLYES